MQDLELPWALAFPPDGRKLVTERPGRLRLIANGSVSGPLAGVPVVFATHQAGLLDVAVAPDFDETRSIYFTHVEPGENGTGGVAVARARLSEAETELENLEVIFREEPKVEGDRQFGSRLVFAPDASCSSL